jgi:NADH-quinone oxidoreductase subunit M
MSLTSFCSAPSSARCWCCSCRQLPGHHAAHRAAATAITALGVDLLFSAFRPEWPSCQFEQHTAWIPAAGLSYHVGLDGLNVGLVLMASLVAFAATCVSWDIERQPKDFYLLLLLMTGGAIGAFVSLDLFFLYFFNELALVPTVPS